MNMTQLQLQELAKNMTGIPSPGPGLGPSHGPNLNDMKKVNSTILDSVSRNMNFI